VFGRVGLVCEATLLKDAWARQGTTEPWHIGQGSSPAETESDEIIVVQLDGLESYPGEKSRPQLILPNINKIRDSHFEWFGMLKTNSLRDLFPKKTARRKILDAVDSIKVST
jgi:hypothetical protein